jgi:hypothetical protein
MPSDFPLWPKVQKGALAVYERDEQSAKAQIIVFQYNPDQLKRTLANRAPQSPPSNAGGAKEDVLRVGGPPVENITLTVALNAIDQPAAPATNGAANPSPGTASTRPWPPSRCCSTRPPSACRTTSS